MLRIAIPDSSLSEQASLLKKSLKLGSIARACGIFCVDRIYIYRDEGGKHRSDGEFAKLFLEYLETPQYLRKRLFGMDERLKYVGLIPPLKLPHHKPKVPIEGLALGELREGVVIRSGRESLVDVGLEQPVLVRRRLEEGKRVTVRIEGKEPLFGSLAKPTGYWGYRVKLVGTLPKLLSSLGGTVVITSRKGRDVRSVMERLRDLGTVTLVFGSPRRGVGEILQDYGRSPEEFTEFVLNTFPGQCVETVRLEEAIMGSLAIFNLVKA